MKKLLSLILACLMCTGILQATACGRKVPNDENTLEVYVLDAGYGVQWCQDLLDLFKEQQWVKDNYPELRIYFSYGDATTNIPENKLRAGETSNTIDLIFGEHLSKFANDGELLDLTELVYERKVPGEGEVTWEQKSNASYNQCNTFKDPKGTPEGEKPKHYMTSWAGGMDSFIYNETILDSFGLAVPNTTKELVKACDIIKANKGKDNGKYNEGYAFIQSKTDYWTYLMPAWWAQYEGVEEYDNFWNGIYDGARSRDIFKQQGRLYALEIMEKLLNYGNAYLNPSSFTYEFMPAQTSFLEGHGVFHANGDWFDNEMRKITEEIIELNKRIDTFKIMPLPINSKLGEKLGIEDEELSTFIDYVDGDIAELPTMASFDAITGKTKKGKTVAQVLSAVKEARRIVHSIGPYHNAVVPRYATAKNIACDFLLFMATDIANEQYIKTTGGASLPFNYNLKEKNPALYNSLSPLQQSRFDYFIDLDVYSLPTEKSYPLAQYGGLTAFVEGDYYNVFSMNGNTATPQSYYDNTINSWDEQRWAKALAESGINN